MTHAEIAPDAAFEFVREEPSFLDPTPAAPATEDAQTIVPWGDFRELLRRPEGRIILLRRSIDDLLARVEGLEAEVFNPRWKGAIANNPKIQQRTKALLKRKVEALLTEIDALAPVAASFFERFHNGQENTAQQKTDKARRVQLDRARAYLESRKDHFKPGRA